MFNIKNSDYKTEEKDVNIITLAKSGKNHVI